MGTVGDGSFVACGLPFLLCGVFVSTMGFWRWAYKIGCEGAADDYLEFGPGHSGWEGSREWSFIFLSTGF